MSDFERLYYYRPSAKHPDPTTVRADVFIFGASVAGVAAAIQVKNDGLTPVIAEFGRRLGGVTASGLGRTDFGDKRAIGGIARKFYRELGKYYGSADPDGTAWYPEPAIVIEILSRWLEEYEVDVHYEQHIETVTTIDGRIRSVAMENGTVFEAGAFIDASYEGDMMAAAGVSYRVGRESNAEYGETLNGIQFGSPHHRFNARVDPYVKRGRPDSGLLPLVTEEPPGEQGAGDDSVQAYNFRLCLTNVPANRMPFPAPPAYDPARFELMSRYVNAGVFDVIDLNFPLVNGKTDLNNRGAISTDHIGANHEWPNGDYGTRQRLFEDHVNYTMGLLYFLSNDGSIPLSVRTRMAEWGLPLDEFIDTGHWPHYLYVREARRLVGEVVVTENHGRHRVTEFDSIGLASYPMDSHNCRRIHVQGTCINEGDVQQAAAGPYALPYRAITPRREECTNLLVPVCLSASHIAFGSIRMEPVFFILGQSAGAAAVLALKTGRPVQEVDYATLRQVLLKGDQRLEPSAIAI